MIIVYYNGNRVPMYGDQYMVHVAGSNFLIKITIILFHKMLPHKMLVGLNYWYIEY